MHKINEISTFLTKSDAFQRLTHRLAKNKTGHEKYFKSVQITLTDQNFSFLRRKSMSVKEHTKLTVVNRAISLLCVLHKYICDNFISVYTY